MQANYTDELDFLSTYQLRSVQKNGLKQVCPFFSGKNLCVCVCAGFIPVKQKPQPESTKSQHRLI